MTSMQSLPDTMIANAGSAPPRSRDSAVLTAEEIHWLHQLETVAPARVLVPMRTTEKLGKLGLIELRASRLTLTERGRQILGRM
jgi:hypothetical protein